jgi:oligopeptide/dipeptide ABC transporter ATP-binding protein
VSAAPATRAPVDRSGDPLLEVRGLMKDYPARDGLFGGKRGTVRAVRDVSVQLWRGETLGLVGESGCGKSTVARTVLRLVEPTEGEIRFDGIDVRGLDAAELKRFRRRAQIVLQDPAGALNPRMTAGEALREVLKVHGLGGPDPAARVTELLERVGLGREHERRYPHELSGGQRQRLGIARALSVEPDLLILDEPVSALDVSIQAQVVRLLLDLQREMRLTYLFIAHDLPLVELVSDRIAVMYLGRVVESAPAGELYDHPRHPYTRALLSAVPMANRRRKGTRRAVLSGDVPSALSPPPGCPFHPRCPHPAKDEACTAEIPALKAVAPGRFAACVKASRDP